MEPILREGQTIWRRARADRVAFLIDGQAYYGAVARAVACARHSIFLVGWDVHSRIELLRGDERDDLPAALGPRFGALLARHPKLEIHVLDWDYPVFFSAERESRTQTAWPQSDRFHFVFDAFCPQGSSHHQKIVLIDDSIVFSGGMDIGLGRWDTSGHDAKDPRRNDPKFPGYNPAHDVMMLASGPIARAMGDLVRERWRRATGSEAMAPGPMRPDCWPGGVTADLEDVDVAISRTIPAHEDQQAVYEIERLYLEAIASAKRWIYIENQYLTSDTVVAALAKRLAEADGPEIVVALPQNNFGWFEARTIQVLHFRRITELRRADRHDRLRVCYPNVPDLGDTQINLHSKVLVVDDRLLRIGSSNLTNRSMRLDTEVDLSIEACGSREADGDAGDPRIRQGIEAFRNRLLAEHLCLEPAEVAAALERRGSMVALVDERIREERCLRSVEPKPEQLEGDIGNGTVIDPKGPITPETLIETFAPPPARKLARRHTVRVAALLVALAALAASWHWTPLQDWIEPTRLAAWGEGLRDSSFAPAAVLLAYLVAAVVVLPVTVLIVVTAAIFGPWQGIAYSLAGSLASALAMFAVGRFTGRSTVEQIAGRHYLRIASGLRNRGLLTMIAIRLLPVAPFTIVNMVVGVTGIRVRDFALGTVIGMSPGIVGLSLFQTQLAEAIWNPGLQSFAVLAIVSAAFVAVLSWLRQRLRVRREEIAEEPTARHQGRRVSA